MQIKYTERALRQYNKLPHDIRNKADKQFENLMTDIRYPSLHAKKYGENDDIWQGRIDKNWRFYFHIINPEYVIVSIITHPK